jgi:hypothetical protein
MQRAGEWTTANNNSVREPTTIAESNYRIFNGTIDKDKEY